MIRELIEMCDNREVIGNVKIYGYPKNSLKGMATSVLRKKSYRNNIVSNIKDSVRKMF